MSAINRWRGSGSDEAAAFRTFMQVSLLAPGNGDYVRSAAAPRLPHEYPRMAPRPPHPPSHYRCSLLGIRHSTLQV
ncbi:hypothetical protein GCM10009864_18800 [Streptomyces lunalinharesii]|uniref:Uncharacterized protein n=1 Tax=Streptomyces lunalinharesii TaxID=333384 RepID=A0ABN3RN92_9ACTN